MGDDCVARGAQSVQQLVCDGSPVDSVRTVFDELSMALIGLRSIRDWMTNEDAQSAVNVQDFLCGQGLLLAATIRHMEQLVDQGYTLAKAGRRPTMPELPELSVELKINAKGGAC